MSLPSQRPNYVLVWIGIVMLTFSMVGQWFLNPGSQSTSSLADSARFTMIYQDAAKLPVQNISNETLASTELFEGENSFDQLVPLQGEEITFDEISLTNHEISLGPDAWSPFPWEPVELQPETTKVEEQQEFIHGIVLEEPKSSDLPEQLHAFNVRQEKDPGLSRKQKAKQRFQDQGQYNATAKNQGYKSANKRKKGDPGPAILVKSKFTAKANGRVAVRFFLGHPGAQNRVTDRLEDLRESENARLAQMAESYLAAMEEVVLEDESDQDDIEQQTKKQLTLHRIAQMKSKIRERISQRPGGVELLAELSPRQLEALMQKLSAQNPKFRALVNSSS